MVMDCDLQDRPEEIPNLYKKAVSEDYDIVFARRAVRHDKWLKRMSSVVHHKMYDWLSDQHTDNSIANFGIYKRCVIDANKEISTISVIWSDLLNPVSHTKLLNRNICC